MIISLVLILLFALLALLTFARNLLAAFLDFIVRIFRKGDRKNTDGEQTVRRRARAKKKVLSDSDGEYVDFEEVKK